MLRFKNIIFFIKIDLKLSYFLQKKIKNLSAVGALPLDSQLPAAGGAPSDPQISLIHCEAPDLKSLMTKQLVWGIILWTFN